MWAEEEEPLTPVGDLKVSSVVSVFFVAHARRSKQLAFSSWFVQHVSFEFSLLPWLLPLLLLSRTLLLLSSSSDVTSSSLKIRLIALSSSPPKSDVGGGRTEGGRVGDSTLR